MSSTNIYINPTRSTVINHTKVQIKDVCSVYCIDLDIKKAVEKIELFQFHKEMDGRQVITVLKMIELIKAQCQNVEIVNLGDPEFIVFHKKPTMVTKKAQIIEGFKILFVCLVSFFGAGFTIMTYNNDVGVNDVFHYLYTLFMGKEMQTNGVLEVGYAVGITLGLLFFFNHVAGKRLTDEPTPLEVEMRLYERDVNDTTAVSSSRNKKTLDVK